MGTDFLAGPVAIRQGIKVVDDSPPEASKVGVDGALRNLM